MRITWEGGPYPVDFDGMYAGYRRLSSVQKVIPPFVWSGTIALNKVMNPPVFEHGWHAGETASYQPKLNFHPLYPSNSRNVVLGPGNVQGDPRVVGISAEVRDIRPERPYGVRTGYERRFRIPLPSSPVDGKRHHFQWDVPAPNHYRLLWDGELVCDVVEKQPATIPFGPVSVGLRLDFLDVELGSMTLEEGASVVTYPNGYGSSQISLARMKQLHQGKMHPEFARRFFAYMEHKRGLLGVGGGWRSTQPDKPGFAPDGKSFHQNQNFAFGFTGYAAVDLVKPNPFDPDGNHVSPAWEDTSDAPDWGLHTFISGEPWHIQCIEMRGWQSWVNAGRPDPPRFTLPADKPPPPDTGGHSVFQKMIRQRGDVAVFALYSGGYKTWVPDEATRDFLHLISGRGVEEIPKNPTIMRATGPILGPVPTGYDEWGIKK